MIPGFQSAERQWENKNPFDGEDNCVTGDCDQCESCLAAIAQDQADAYAEGKWEDYRFESRYGA
jgi:hypothetical protein